MQSEKAAIERESEKQQQQKTCDRTQKRNALLNRHTTIIIANNNFKHTLAQCAQLLFGYRRVKFEFYKIGLSLKRSRAPPFFTHQYV